MSVDYLVIASRNAAVTARFGSLERSVAEPTNIVGGTVQCRHARSGLFVLTVDDCPRPQDLSARTFTIFDGIGLFGRTLVQSAADLASERSISTRRFWQLRARRPVASQVRGNFMVARHGRSGVTLFADVLGTYPIFVYQANDLFCASNNVYLVERALSSLGIVTTPDLTELSYVVTLGNGAFDLTGFREIRLLAPGEIVEIDRRNHVTVHPAQPPSWMYCDRPLGELLDDAADEILASVRAIAGAPFTHRICDLSGGMDSRLVVAAILHEQLAGDFVFFTSGIPPSPDVTVATMIRQRFGLRRVRNIDPSVAGLGVFDSMRHYLARTSGCFSMFYGAGGVGQPIRRDLMRLGGNFGETFRGFYGAVYGGKSRKIPEAEQGPLARLIRTTRMKADLFLAVDAVPGHLDKLAHFAEDMSACGVKPDDMPDVFYLRNRTRYHFGTQWRVSGFTRSVFHPLYSLAAIRASYAMSLADRIVNRPGYELMKRFCPALLEVPFADDAWDAALGTQPVPAVTRDSPAAEWPDEPALTLYPGTGSHKGSSSRRSAKLRAEGRNKKWIDLELALEEFTAAHASDEGFERLRPTFDPQRVSSFLRRPVAEYTNLWDAWTAYRLMGAYIWANRLETPPGRAASAARAAR